MCRLDITVMRHQNITVAVFVSVTRPTRRCLILSRYVLRGKRATVRKYQNRQLDRATSHIIIVSITITTYQEMLLRLVRQKFIYEMHTSLGRYRRKVGCFSILKRIHSIVKTNVK